MAKLRIETQLRDLELQIEHKQKELELQQTVADAQAKLALAKAASDLEQKRAELEITIVNEERKGLEHATQHLHESEQQALTIEMLEAEVKAVADKASAVTPDLVAALQEFGDKAMLERVAQSMAPMALIGGKSVTEVLSSLLSGTKLADYFANKELGAGSAR